MSHGALWHFNEAERLVEIAEGESWYPEDGRLERVSAVLAAAQVHATLFVGLTQVLSTATHGRVRADLAVIAGGESDSPDPESSTPPEG